MQLLNKYSGTFAANLKDRGSAKVEPIRIKVEDMRPISRAPYKQSLAEREVIKKEMEDMLEAGIIRESRSPWGFPVLGIPKKDGTIRVCVDYRPLNERTLSDQFPIPQITDVLDRLQGKTVFSTLDLKAGYWQIPLDKQASQITAFTTMDGHYEFTRLPFGIKNAPAEFSRIMKGILGDLRFVEIYLDDITVHSKDLSSHLEHLETVFVKDSVLSIE